MANKKKKPRKRMNVFVRILLTILILIILLGVVAIGLVAGSLYGYVEDTKLIDVENMRLNLTSFIYITDPETGETVESEKLYDTENRIWAPGSEIPEHLKNAFVAIEDERFYSHHGFDFKRLLGAAIQYVSNKGNSSYGGSTITQQLIKNLTQDDEYDVKRKIREIYRAVNLERELSKDEILEYYLNTIYLSQKCNGVASAANTYFGKNVSDLTLAECASIAGITQFPTKYDPFVNPENNIKRQKIILKKMKDLKFITEDEYNEAVNEKLVFNKNYISQDKIIHSYYTDAAIEQIIEDLMVKYNYTREYAGKVVYNGGLRIYLGVDTDIQDKLDKIYNDPNTFKKSGREIQPQSAMVIMDPYTGIVKALIGGRGEKDANRTLNRATQTLRQPGSTIKPLSVYSPAIEYGLITPSSIINDAPFKIGNWSPRNDDRKFRGRITVRSALRGSRNVPATKICDYVTPEASFNYVKDRYHISTLVDHEVKNGKSFTDKGHAAIALGGLTHGVTVMEMCAAFSAFPTGGTYHKPCTYTKVVDSNGEILLEYDKKGQIAMSETTSRDMVSMLTDVVTGGTGRAAAIPDMRAAGKTGTTSSNNDRWFVGFTPYYTGAVWFGYDKPSSLRGYSPNPAAVAWRKVMTEIHKGLDNKPFFDDLDKSKRTMMVCAESGMRATPSCTKVKAEVFDANKIPEKTCNIHTYKFNRNDLKKGGHIQKHDSNLGVDMPIEPEEGKKPENGTDLEPHDNEHSENIPLKPHDPVDLPDNKPNVYPDNNPPKYIGGSGIVIE